MRWPRGYGGGGEKVGDLNKSSGNPAEEWKNQERKGSVGGAASLEGACERTFPGEGLP